MTVRPSPRESALNSQRRLDLLTQHLRGKPVPHWLSKLYGEMHGTSLWGDLQAYCLFIGYTRSGHSAIGSAIDAHPQAVVSHELDAVWRYLQGVSRDELFLEIFWLAREQARAGRHSPKVGGGSYLHQIEGQLKQTPHGLRLIGDKKGAGTVLQCAQHGLDRLADFLTFVRLPVKILHVVRNPFDMVAAALVNGEVEQPYSFLQLVPIVARIREHYGGDNWLDVYHEDVLADPCGQMSRILAFLDLPALNIHLERCRTYFFPAPYRRRFEVEWPPALQLRVQQAIEHHTFLHCYSWDS